MQIKIHENGMRLDDSVQNHALERVTYELSNNDIQNLSVLVTLSEHNDHTGIDYKYCNLQVNSEHFKELIIDEKASDFYIAINKASEKARRIMLGRIFRQMFYSRQNNSYLESRA